MNENETLRQELAEARRQQTAMAEVLEAIAQTSYDRDEILRRLLRTAAKLCDAESGGIWLVRDDHLVGAIRMSGDPEEEAFLQSVSYPMNSLGSLNVRCVLSGEVLQVSDAHDGSLKHTKVRDRFNIGSFLNVPMMRNAGGIGLFSLTRSKASVFSDPQIALVRSFAAQAVIAITNANRMKQLEQRTAELDQSLQELRATQARLISSEKLASLGQLTAGVAHEIKNPLNFVNNFSKLSVELLEELAEALRAVELSQTLKDAVKDLTQTLTDNLGKIRHHGQRADSIVRNMLLHARQDGGERRAIDLNAVIDQSLTLTCHGVRAVRRDFDIDVQRDLDPAVGTMPVFPQELTRVLLNLFSNGFYAAFERAGEPGFKPSLRVSTRANKDRVEICVRDNGNGVPEAIRDKLFTPFFTTKPTGEGTGLGLSLSYEVIVKQHGGSISFETETGVFTEFTITLPRDVTEGRRP